MIIMVELSHHCASVPDAMSWSREGGVDRPLLVRFLSKTSPVSVLKCWNSRRAWVQVGFTGCFSNFPFVFGVTGAKRSHD